MWSPWKSVWHFFWCNTFCRYSVSRNLSVFPWHQNYGFYRVREMKSFYFSPKWRSSELPIEFFCLTAGSQRSSYCVMTMEVRLAFCFNIIHFVHTQFRENLSVFHWHKNCVFSRSREMKSFYFSPKWWSSGLPIEWLLLCNCGLPTAFLLCEARGVRVAFFLCNTFCRYSVSRKS